MKDLGYTEHQQKKMAEVMYILREWFQDSIIIVKDNKQPIYWEHECDEDLIYPLLENAYYGLCAPDDEVIVEFEGDDTPEWLEGDEWMEEEE